MLQHRRLDMAYGYRGYTAPTEDAPASTPAPSRFKELAAQLGINQPKTTDSTDRVDPLGLLDQVNQE